MNEQFRSGQMRADPVEDSSERSIPQILGEIISRVGEIIRSEIRLSTTEITRDLTQRAKAAGYLVLAGALMLYGGGFVLLGAVYAISLVWPSWLAALSVGVVTAAAGAIFFSVGQDRLKHFPRPEFTIRPLEDNLKWPRKQHR